MSLTGEQRRRVVRIARDKGVKCPDCDSTQPVPEDEARLRPGGGAEVVMRCLDCESASEMTLALTPEQAKALGLHALRDRPEGP